MSDLIFGWKPIAFKSSAGNRKSRCSSKLLWKLIMPPGLRICEFLNDIRKILRWLQRRGVKPQTAAIEFFPKSCSKLHGRTQLTNAHRILQTRQSPCSVRTRSGILAPKQSCKTTKCRDVALLITSVFYVCFNYHFCGLEST